MLVDIDLVLGLHSPIGPEVRSDADLRSTLIANTWDFGWLGATSAHRARSGFSLWLPTSGATAEIPFSCDEHSVPGEDGVRRHQACHRLEN